MTNREKFLDEILAKGCCKGIATLRTGKRFCSEIGEECSECKQNNLKWLKAEYEEPGIDWTKVPVDTLIEVSDFEDFHDSLKRYFAMYHDKKVWTWTGGASSKTISSINDITSWEYARLVEE